MPIISILFYWYQIYLPRGICIFTILFNSRWKLLLLMMKMPLNNYFIIEINSRYLNGRVQQERKVICVTGSFLIFFQDKKINWVEICGKKLICGKNLPTSQKENTSGRTNHFFPRNHLPHNILLEKFSPQNVCFFWG